MRAIDWIAVALIAPSLAGCVDGPPKTVGPGASMPLCANPCERAVDLSPRRAFEPTAALDPVDPDRAIVVSSQFRDDPSFGHPMDMFLHRTTDRGASWETNRLWDVLPMEHAAKRYNMWADPMAVWLEDGTLMLMGMGATGANPPDGPVPVLGFTAFDVWFARSFDGGTTWPDGGVVYAGDGFQSVAPTPAEHGDQPHIAVGPDGTVVVALIHVTDGKNRVMVLTSTNQGASWTEQTPVAAGPDLHNARPAVLDDGTIVVAYRDRQNGHADGPVLLSRSEDGGTSWTEIGSFPALSRPTLASRGTALELVLAQDIDERLSVVHASSKDGGNTWTTTVLDEALRNDTIVVNAAGRSDGNLYITWNRPLQGDANAFMAFHMDGNGLSRMQRLDTTPIGPNGLTGIEGLTWNSLGDYFGLAATKDGAVSAWISGAGSGQDVRAAWLSPIGAPAMQVRAS